MPSRSESEDGHDRFQNRLRRSGRLKANRDPEIQRQREQQDRRELRILRNENNRQRRKRDHLSVSDESTGRSREPWIQ